MVVALLSILIILLQGGVTPTSTEVPEYRLVYSLRTANGDTVLYQVDMETFESSFFADCSSSTTECIAYSQQAYGHALNSFTSTSIRRVEGQIELVIRSDGVEKLLTHTPGDDLMGDWSPDGRQITFVSIADDQHWEGDLYVINRDGSEQRKLTDTRDYDEQNPAWSPDGEWIAFERRFLESGGAYIYKMRPDGTDLQQVSPENGNGAVWSPDNKWIAYSSYRGGAEIYVSAADGSEEKRLTRTPGYDENPVWSPDGEWIVFESALDGNIDLYLVKADGSEIVQLTDSSDSEINPVWMEVSDQR